MNINYVVKDKQRNNLPLKNLPHSEEFTFILSGSYSTDVLFSGRFQVFKMTCVTNDVIFDI